MKLLYKGGRLHISLNADPAQKIRKNVRYLRISNSERYEKLDRYHPNTTENLVTTVVSKINSDQNMIATLFPTHTAADFPVITSVSGISGLSVATGHSPHYFYKAK